MKWLTSRNWLSLPLLLLTFAFILSSCGGASTGSSTNSNTGSNEQSQERVIKHTMGETRVPAHPQRVVVLDTAELDAVLALGITPVGSVSAFSDGKFLDYLGDKTKTIQNVGTIAQPNLEKIASLGPDLILSTKFRHADIYKQLSSIAPTVFAENVGVAWKENFQLYADALNKKAEAAQLVQNYNNRIAEFKQKMGPRLSQTQVSVIRVLSDRVRLYAHQTFIGTLLKDAGLPRPSAQNVDKKFVEEMTYENIKSMDGDVLFLMQYGKDRSKLEALTSQPQWKALNASKQKKVFEVSDDIWSLGIGYLAADKVIDDLLRYVAQ